jgi:preprotein translocase subunit SecD
MRKQEAVPLLSILVLTIAALVYTFTAGNSPLLGLDLQGGVSVVLQPTEPATDEELEQSISIMRRRVDALGVAEPEVARQGDNILVQLPGVEDTQRALELVGQTAELRFRPVIEEVDPSVVELTEPEDDLADVEVVLDGEPQDGFASRYRLGPTALTGTAVVTANALLDIDWYVLVELERGPDALDRFNQLAADCFSNRPNCPSGRLGIVIDGTVISAPVFQTSSFPDGNVSITGQFTQQEAQDLATALRFGALPVELETLTTQTVSATLGRDALDAGIVAGVVGLLIVGLYMIAYYRLLGVVAMVSLAVSFGLLWSIVSWLGATQGLALTLAGVTGLIVSIGVSVDSNIVYFENVKEDVREGRPVRSSVERSFKTAFSTIVKADVTTLIGAGLLYWLTIGPVRGFAFYLALATILDLIVSYFLMRPMVVALGRSPRFHGRSQWLGIPVGEVAPGAAPAAKEAVSVGGGAS